MLTPLQSAQSTAAVSAMQSIVDTIEERRREVCIVGAVYAVHKQVRDLFTDVLHLSSSSSPSSCGAMPR